MQQGSRRGRSEPVGRSPYQTVHTQSRSARGLGDEWRIVAGAIRSRVKGGIIAGVVLAVGSEETSAQRDAARTMRGS